MYAPAGGGGGLQVGGEAAAEGYRSVHTFYRTLLMYGCGWGGWGVVGSGSVGGWMEDFRVARGGVMRMLASSVFFRDRKSPCILTPQRDPNPANVI